MKIGLLDPLEALVFLFGQAAQGGFHLAEELALEKVLMQLPSKDDRHRILPYRFIRSMPLSTALPVHAQHPQFSSSGAFIASRLSGMAMGYRSRADNGHSPQGPERPGYAT